MSQINTYPMISLTEASAAVMLYGVDITPTFISEPGVGKTTVLRQTAINNGDKWRRPGDYFPDDKYVYVYFDCSSRDLPDVMMGVPVHEHKTIEGYVNEVFKINDPRPKVIMLDEIRKAPKILQLIFSRLKLERYVGDNRLPDGSVVFCTSNNASDGVGDNTQAHDVNREQYYKVMKPNHKQCAVWGGNNGVDPLLIGWAIMNPKAFASYMTCTTEELNTNPYIFNPNKPVQPFLSPRSWAKCTSAVRNRHIAGENLTRAALCGTVGQAAGDSIMSYLSLSADLHKFDDIIADPDNLSMPEKTAAIVQIVVNGVNSIETQDQLSRFIRYIKRCRHAELQSLFFTMVAKNDKTKMLANGNPDVQSWMVSNKNYELLI